MVAMSMNQLRGCTTCLTLADIARGFGPDIAWFKDPAGHTLSVLKES